MAVGLVPRGGHVEPARGARRERQADAHADALGTGADFAEIDRIVVGFGRHMRDIGRACAPFTSGGSKSARARSVARGGNSAYPCGWDVTGRRLTIALLPIALLVLLASCGGDDSPQQADRTANSSAPRGQDDSSRANGSDRSAPPTAGFGIGRSCTRRPAVRGREEEDGPEERGARRRVTRQEPDHRRASEARRQAEGIARAGQARWRRHGPRPGAFPCAAQRRAARGALPQVKARVRDDGARGAGEQVRRRPHPRGGRQRIRELLPRDLPPRRPRRLQVGVLGRSGCQPRGAQPDGQTTGRSEPGMRHASERNGGWRRLRILKTVYFPIAVLLLT